MQNFINELSDNWAVNSGLNPLSPSEIMSTYSPTWRQTYLDQQMHKNDPVAKKAMSALRAHRPISIDRADYTESMFEEAHSNEAAANIVFTSFFGGNIMIAGAVVDTPKCETLHTELNNALGATHRASIIKKIANLTDRQIEVLELAEMGMIAGQIAADLGISVQAIAKHKAAICKALSIMNFAAAIQAYSLEKWSPFMK